MAFLEFVQTPSVGRKRLPRGQGGRGHKIHVCELLVGGESCGKVYSRAEHLRRHQLSHSGPFIACRYEGCGLRFHRQDVADRHATTHAKRGEGSDTSAPMSTRASSPSPQPPQSLGHRDSEEFEVMYHYVTAFDSLYIHRDSCGKNVFGGREWWLTTLPRISYSHDAVKDLALSIASAHLTTLKPDSNMYQKSSRYLVKAVAAHREQVSKLDQQVPQNTEDIDALCLMSYFLCIRTKMTLLDPEHPGDAEQHFSNFLLWISMCQGHAALSTVAGNLSQDTDYWRLVVTCEDKSSSTFADFQRFLRESPGLKYLSRLFESVEQETRDRPEEREAYWTMLNLVEWAYHYFLDGGSSTQTFSVCIAMMFMIPPAFTALLRARRPCALAILAYYFCLDLHPVFSDIWWIASSADVRIRALAGLVPPKWAWTMRWPLLVANREAEIADFEALALGGTTPHGRLSVGFSSPEESHFCGSELVDMDAMGDADAVGDADAIGDAVSFGGAVSFGDACDEWNLPLPALFGGESESPDTHSLGELWYVEDIMPAWVTCSV